MTDMGTADRFFVCGPDCKAIPADRTAPMEPEPEESGTPWWEMLIAIVLVILVVGFATVGALDVGMRAALNYWHF